MNLAPEAKASISPAGATSSPKVSVCMLTYNHEKFIAQALESALRQETALDYEIVVGEDCSTDSTRSIVADYARRYPEKIRPVLHARNMGLMGKGNFAATLKACQGQYVAMLEGDDYWADPCKLQKQVDFLERNPGFAVCGHWVKNVDASGNLLKKQVFTGEDCPEVFGVEHALVGTPVHTGSWVFRFGVLLSDIRRNMDSYTRLPGGDNLLLLMILLRGQGYCFREFMGAYRIHTGAMYTSKPEVLWRYEALQLYYSLPRFLGENLTGTLGDAVSHRIKRGEDKLAYAIGHCSGPAALLQLLRAVKSSTTVPRRRITAILARVPFVIAQRLIEYLKSFLPQTLRSRVKRCRGMMAAWISRHA